MLKNNFIKSNNKAFTLIELIVSMALIVTAVLAAMGIYMKVIGTREKTLGQVNIQEDGQYLMGMIVKDIRAGLIDYSNYIEPLASPEEKLLLLDFSGNQIRYQTDLSGSGICALARCSIKRCKNADCSDDNNFQSITMTNVSVERLDFYIIPVSNPFTTGSTSYVHPRVTIVLKLKSLIEKIGEKQLTLQQTVPQRYTYRK